MKSQSDKDRAKRWRLENPDKVRAQRERRQARVKGELAPYDPQRPTPEQTAARRKEDHRRFYAKHRERMASDPDYAEKFKANERLKYQRKREQMQSDPAALEAYRTKKRNEKRLAAGIPLDKPVMLNKIPEADRHARKLQRDKQSRDRKRAAYRIANGIPLDAPVRVRKPKKPKRPTRLQVERAKRSAEVAAAKAINVQPAEPVVCPDPPELQALFKKASRGEPARPHNPYVKKRTAFQIRGWV